MQAVPPCSLQLFINQKNRRVKMKKIKLNLIAFIIISFVLGSCQKEVTNTDARTAADADINAKKTTGPATVSVFATGFNNPRGIRLGPDGNFYVAEAGLGGTENHDAECPALVPPDGPYLGSPTGGRLSRVSPEGARTTVTDQFPTVKSNFGDVLGVQDVAFIGNTMYVLFYGGCGHGVPSLPTGIARVNADATYTLIANLENWRVTHPVAHPATYDNDPGGAWNNMISIRNDLYAVDANHGEIVKVTTDGVISRVVDISAEYGHIVPTALAYHGNLYMGNLGLFPIVDGSTNIYKISAGGQIKVVATGLTTVIGLVIDNWNRMYVLEMSTGNDFPTPGTGRIVRIDPNGSKEVIVTGLSNPTALTIGQDGNLYVLNWSFGAGEGAGQVLKVTL
jgi:hypothetical protein